jgi:hypothetical protein
VPKIVPAKVFDTDALERLIPSFRADLANRFAAKAEHVRGMLAKLPADDCHGIRIQRHGNGLPRFSLVRMDPR